MKRILICAFILSSLLGYSQQKKKSYRKPVRKSVKASVKKVTPPKSTTIIEAEKKEEPPIVEEAPKEIVKEEVKAVVEEPTTQTYIQKIAKKKGWINNRNSVYVRGIEAFIKGSYVHKDKIFIMIDVFNRTNIDYDIESISFVTSPISKKEKHIVQEEKVFIPVDSNQPERIDKKIVYRLIFAFEKFTISDNINLMFLMDEANGDRSINLPIKASYITNSEYIK